MDSKKFLSTLATTGTLALIFTGYMADHSFTLYERRMTLLVWVLLCLLCLVISYLTASSHLFTRARVTSRNTSGSRMTAQERENALLFRHYPQSANFRVRQAANEQHNRFTYTFKR